MMTSSGMMTNCWPTTTVGSTKPTMAGDRDSVFRGVVCQKWQPQDAPGSPIGDAPVWLDVGIPAFQRHRREHRRTLPVQASTLYDESNAGDRLQPIARV